MGECREWGPKVGHPYPRKSIEIYVAEEGGETNGFEC